MARGQRRPTEGLLQEVLIYAILSLCSCAALSFGLRSLDPNRANAKKAAQRKKEISARLGRPYLKTNEYEDLIALDVVIPDKLTVDFKSIGGLEDVKDSLHELIILPLQRPELFSRGNLLKPVKGCLLYGPPGTGKTLLAKAVAKESRACFINVRLSTIQSKWFGEAQKLVTAIFTLAWKLQPSIIFIDEIDSFLGQRKSNEHEVFTNMKTEFMTLWDGFTTSDEARVMVLAATNRPWEVDEAILRRLPRTYEIPLPNESQREGILRVLMKEEPLARDMMGTGQNSGPAKLARLTEGYSGSDLQELCKQAAYNPIRDYINQERARGDTLESLASRGQGAEEEEEEEQPQLRPLEYADFRSSLNYSKPSALAAMQYEQNVNKQKAEAQGSFSSGGQSQNQAAMAQQMQLLQMAMGLLANQNMNRNNGSPGNNNNNN